VIFQKAKVAIFADGDFWHGRNLASRLSRLSSGHNAPYWVAKIRANCQRDKRRTAELRRLGWTVLRFWESEISRDPAAVALTVGRTVLKKLPVLTENRRNLGTSGAVDR
jgi:DNA mismatch endonuclease (patch repair protein)